MANEAPDLSIFERMLAEEQSELDNLRAQVQTLTPSETKRKERIEKSISAEVKRIGILEKRSVANLPFTLRQLYDALKEEKVRNALPYPNFTQVNSMRPTNLVPFLQDLKKYELDRLKPEDLAHFIERVKSVFRLDAYQRTDVAINDVRDILCFLDFLQIVDGNLERLVEGFTEDYAVYFNMGSGFVPGQLVPQDEEFMTNVIRKHSKHIFFVFDKERDTSSLAGKKFQLSPNSEEGSFYHAHYISQLESFFGANVSYERFNDNCFTYTFKPTDDPTFQEFKLIFFNSYLCNYIFSLFDSLIKAASLRFFLCMASYGPGNELGGCDNFVFSNLPYVFKTFDYYLINPYEKTPYYTHLKEAEYFHFNRNENKFKVNKFLNKVYPTIQPLPILNLREARKQNLTILFPEIRRRGLMNHESVSRHINLSAVERLGVPFKLRGNHSYWNIIRGGKQTRKKSHRKAKKQTRRRG